MLKLKTFDIPENPAPEDCFLELILSALQEKGRVPEETPDVGLGHYHVRENLDHLTLEKVPGGWVCNIIFRRLVGTEIDCITSSMHQPFPSAAEAFLFGASIACEIVTGSAALPFEVVGSKLVMAGCGNMATVDC